MFGFIKKLFSGIAAFFSGLLGGGKKGGYYLELKEDSSAPEAPKAEAPKKVEAPKAEAPKKVEAPKAEAPKPEPVAAKAAPAPEAPKQEAPKVELVQTATGLEAVPAPETNGKIAASSSTTFAPQYLNPISNSNPRRRPGANMAMYQDMARQVNTPSA